MKKTISAIALTAVLSTQLTGCMGQMGLSAMVTKANLSAVDNRYGRAGLFMLLSPIYGFAATGDLFIINSIEFWTGTNPITGRSPAVVDMPVEAIFKVNQHIDGDLTTAPLKNVKLTSASMVATDENTLAMTLVYEDGSQQVMSGVKDNDHVDFYLDNAFIARVSTAELAAYQQG
ncbi:MULTISPECIES: DUF3332 domain-containing protein [Shewanella]|uniref:DUF3332 domain-containing protein n=1 Tax=Shewanella pneumatophori TaxID=314092 RepID=A0A9X1ZLH4_9GAMM|nr:MULTISPECIES: DUF3332 domain-containing protein [Shewanella]MCK8044785.1 DUF3332 domain-containing protein [Shewanella sp. 1CM18E]MCL1140083.1 DUF3332 domain-containing protein [Shewanella pneumatophori]